MEIHFLGTNGWHDSESGETPCILVHSQEAYVIFDAGNALRKIDRIIKGDKPIYLFLSHFHLDHTFGLHILAKFSFEQGLTIVGQPGTKAALAKLLARPFTAPLSIIRKKYRVEILEIPQGKTKLRDFDVEARSLVHADPCFGYSLALEGKKITYCTDTGSCPNLIRLAKGSDLLMAECSWKKRHENSGWPHLAPEDAATAAKEAGCGKLVLVHFDANNYKDQDSRIKAQQKARKIFSNTFAAKDDLKMRL